MDNKKAPTEKELENIVKKVDKLVKKTEKLKTNASASASSSNNNGDQVLMKQQLRQLMENMALMEQSGLIKSSAKKDLGSHKFWSTQPVPNYGTFFSSKIEAKTNLYIIVR